eukprot:TRINITY_DN69531_c0_g1_i1.p1 TRINITY_DN69531_c0_g1~~TRINITY_DN69531_c0_g1_i1.p1  ORF type:complete len:246 (+),score=17.31 TRINITY_DN69531_c0_g1_i1:75-740(+)
MASGDHSKFSPKFVPSAIAMPSSVVATLDQALDEPERPDRPKSAVYMRRRCRNSKPSPRVRCHSARGQTKTERWREAGAQRWPPMSDGENRTNPNMALPMNQRYAPFVQPSWQNELWTRSLRKPGVLIQHPLFASGNSGVKELHEQWIDLLPSSPREWPYSGATASGKASMRPPADVKMWVERPVAAGKYSLNHLDGQRYEWNSSPRYCLTGLSTRRAAYG